MEVNVAIAFGAGLLGFFAPCFVPLFPVYISYLAGEMVGKKRRSWLIRQAGLFVVGFGSVFVVLGMAVSGLSGWLKEMAGMIQLIGGLILVVMGLGMSGVVRSSWMQGGFAPLQRLSQVQLGWLRPVLLGVVFGSSWSPCLGPVLGLILTLAAQSESVLRGGLLLAVYAMGMSLPFVLAAAGIGEIDRWVGWGERFSKRYAQVVGWLLVGFGVLLVNNQVKVGPEWLRYGYWQAYLMSEAAGWQWYRAVTKW